MTPDRWRKIEELYHSTLERGENERIAFLNEVCAGDEALRREVESLLACEGEPEQFLEKPALEWPQERMQGVGLAQAGETNQSWP